MSEPYEGWAIVELMGHRRLAAHVSEQEIAGTAFLRLDVHNTEDQAPVVTQFYSPSAVYCITPTTEDIARKIGERSSPAPVSRFELEPPGREPWTEDTDEDLDREMAPDPF
jgi:hypothetical protein